ncbi:complement receptor type 1-like isoform X1 [Bufo gargarizans]|uniref:complement receptor type 1-like isoform X1 n=1 Tax=Bufo gargarizans TaxID=30331 RepID=UPI001CF1ACDC|nr:complement receptor type 1-like isoform X1 [Bufo gargarizans]
MSPVWGAVRRICTVLLVLSQIIGSRAVRCPIPNVDNASKVSGFTGPYNPNSVVRFRCRPQYKMIGSDTVKCNESSKWEPELPKCIGTCQSFPRYQYAELVEPTTELRFPEGTILNYRCKEGYEPIPSAVNTVTCLRLRWSSSPEFCKPITCVEPETVPNGRIISDSFLYGSHITYVCETGYKIKNSISRKCLSDQSWSLPIPECEVQTCATPEHLQNGWYSPVIEEYFYNDTITYNCHDGFQLVGQASITCRSDGRWNYNTPVCRGICDAPPDLPYAQLQFQYLSMKTYFAGTTLQYVCRPGYYQVYGYTNYITCLGNFTWSKISEFCKIYKCGSPAYVKNGWYDPEMEEYFYNDTVTYGCDEGFQLVGQDTITCLDQRRWSYNTPECRGICDAPPDLLSAQLYSQYQNIKTFFTGTTLQYVCRPGYYQVYGYTNSITCLGNFTWSKISEFCKIYTCPTPAYVKNGWYDPEMEEYFYNDTVTYGCHEGFQLVGQDTITCLDQGRWSYNTPQCTGICGDPPELHFAQLDLGFKHITTFFVGSPVQYNCRPGYIRNSMYNNNIAC